MAVALVKGARPGKCPVYRALRDEEHFVPLSSLGGLVGDLNWSDQNTGSQKEGSQGLGETEE